MRRFTASLILASALGLGLPAAFAAPLLTPAELAERVSSPAVRILDIRDGKNEAGKTPYELGHLPGAVHAPYSQWRGTADNPGKLPDTAKLSALLQRLGLDANTEVVVVHQGKDATDFGAAARVYWTLKTAGLSKLSILNGGVQAWQAAGKPLSTEAPSVAPSTYVAKIDPRLVATRAEVEKAVASSSSRLLDARPADFFAGETRHVAAKVPGTIQGATNVSHAVWFGKDGRAMLPADEVRRVAQRNGIETGKDDTTTVSFCNTGHWAATNWFVLSEVLGDRNVKMYPESMVEWSAAGLPMANVPNRLKQLLIDLKLATK
ncbi:sulfurtransferase [Quisquiliibacterium transsilvanicum]|uniref:Thiosulfate/3-mercaptopyruvate sulfurtransferase n=1 Tax=Quisquiliibacterium transsilvanicum TaxID=1549638 RepID=A0A7W8MAY6_9BURK|nr:sulfurtransferase [Quisquiliibacterium transsilvanicum]MBB5273584.1 thiosulfate/3-mercaptopyruvate sulfurtransferase [Quisquiliibacterium transsilvanicum]